MGRSGRKFREQAARDNQRRAANRNKKRQFLEDHKQETKRNAA